MKLFISDGFGPKTCDLVEEKRVGHKVMRYIWNNEVLMFQGLVIPKLEERKGIVNVIHAKIDHLSEHKNSYRSEEKIFLT
jgi:hypothetical protein